MPSSPSPFARYFKAVAGRKVSRYGSGFIGLGGYRADQVIGAAGHGSVTAISHDEAAKFRREYDRAVEDGSLVEVDAKAYQAWQDLCEERAKAATAEQARAGAEEEDLAVKQAAARVAKKASKAKEPKPD